MAVIPSAPPMTSLLETSLDKIIESMNALDFLLENTQIFRCQ